MSTTTTPAPKTSKKPVNIASFLSGLGCTYKPISKFTTTKTAKIGNKTTSTSIERVKVGNVFPNIILPNSCSNGPELHTMRQFFIRVFEAGLSISYGYDDDYVYIAFWLDDCHLLMALLEIAMASRPYNAVGVAIIDNRNVVVDGNILPPGDKKNPTPVVYFDERLDKSALPLGFVNLNPTFKLANELRKMMVIHSRKAAPATTTTSSADPSVEWGAE